MSSLVEGPGDSTRPLDLPRFQAAAISVEDEFAIRFIGRSENNRSSLRATVEADGRNDREMPLVLRIGHRQP